MKKYKQSEVASFMIPTKDLLATRQSMEDIFNVIVKRNPRDDISISFDENGKIQRASYEEFRNQVFLTAGKLSRLLSSTRAGCVIGLKLKNSPRWVVIFWALLMSGHSPFRKSSMSLMIMTSSQIGRTTLSSAPLERREQPK